MSQAACCEGYTVRSIRCSAKNLAMPGTVGSPGTRRCNPRFQHLQTLGLPVFGLPFAMATSHFDPVACLALYIQTAPAGLRFLQRFGHPCVALGKDSKARPRRSRPSEEPPVPCTASRPAPATPPAPPRPQIAFLAGSREQGIWKKVNCFISGFQKTQGMPLKKRV